MKHAREDYNRRIVDLDNKIPENEPVFLLRGQDLLAPKLLLMWAMELRLQGGDPEMAASAEAHAQEMIRWQQTHKVKTPDMYKDSPQKQFIKDKLKKMISDIKSGIMIPARDIESWVKKYYDSDGLVAILMPFDVKEEARSTKSESELEYDDFNLNDEEKIKLYNAKLILYYSSKNIIVLKDGIS